MIRCGHCGERKPPEEFSPSQRKDGFWCRGCKRERYQETRGNRERLGETLTCAHCGQDAPRRGPKQRYCSPNCKQRARYWRLNPPTRRSCEVCGTDISQMRADARVCSHRCTEVRRRTGKAYAEWRRARNLRQNYGMSPEEYDALLASQGGGCAICGRQAHPGNDVRRLHVDHDHDTGRIRGILCANCNRILGLAADDSALLRKAADYLA